MEATVTTPPFTARPVIPGPTKALGRLLCSAPAFELHGPDAPDRTALEAYIAAQFALVYDARVSEYLPLLLSMQCQNRYSAVAGLRRASTGRLFVEQYLDEPIEQALSARVDQPTARADIVEIGNLVATHRGACQMLFVLMAAMTHRAGVGWAVFSATRQVRRLIAKLDFAAVPLGPADPPRLGDATPLWGRYYDTKPELVVIDVATSIGRLEQSTLPAAVLALYRNRIDQLACATRVAALQ